ncbi:polysaccharide pyruvyl transferase family protein [Colwellia sp. 6_MG-2023]|uniref:polysaccharide pyruvyl transferase family protein n=1 Tax=Colwellia sp. 6_MG-2023 TaxID=3062676 RepID=UPI0026E425FC|nr:polysaccharide pyruvyl transferase family protein [Colwellia sp. 6_MG-2023]MDO6487712.1 polysaccharide pyruvyl transferase family protein [Colwellia sp. 6_MG-2023]
MKSKLKDIFRNYARKEFVFVKPGGNFGDDLIYFGAESLAKELGLIFKTYSISEFKDVTELKNKVIYIHGGGAFNEWCSEGGWSALEKACSFNCPVIYGPCSVGENPDFLNHKFKKCINNNKSESVIIFAREEYTYNTLISLPSLKHEFININQDIDTAFHLTKEIIEARVGRGKRAYDFYAFREDNEGCAQSHEVNYNNVMFDPAKRCQSFEHWMRVHLYANKIITNRTHSSIIGAILKKKTYLFEGRYHKNKSIHKEVLDNMGVQWLEPNEAISLAKKGMLDAILPAFIKNSWRIRSFFLYMNGVPLK